MQKYIDYSLEAEIIQPSSSPAGAGSFFLGKRDGGLKLCIDFCGLNKILAKNRCPLPLNSSVFELLKGAQIDQTGSKECLTFSKDKRGRIMDDW